MQVWKTLQMQNSRKSAEVNTNSLQIMREMLLAPNLLILDEPDVFLDFANLNSLCDLIRAYKGNALAVTHNRYLLSHCFDQILHLENRDLQVFDGTYSQYQRAVFAGKTQTERAACRGTG